MDYPRPCGCKGCRTCLLCEKEFGIAEKSIENQYKDFTNYIFCYECNKIYRGDCIATILAEHPTHGGQNGIEFPGVYIQTNFITGKEEDAIMTGIDEMPWDISQSGRRKQNFGPKTNFKKMKMALGHFKGFPEFSKFLQEKFESVPLLRNFQTIEQCSLEYDPSKGASIDPHIDDCWVWGERVVTVNCLSDSILTLARYNGDLNRYNLPLVETYGDTLIHQLVNDQTLNEFESILVQLPMPNRSLIVLYGPARYQFEHCIFRKDIAARRVCIAYREFTPLYLPGGCHYEQGETILNNSQLFWKHSIKNT